jgi:hypothetical protein
MRIQFGEHAAREAAHRAEYLWNEDPTADPFAHDLEESDE